MYDISAPRNAEIQAPMFGLVHVKNPQSLTQGTISMFGQGESKFSLREWAQTRKVRNHLTGLELDWTPNDNTGIVGFIRNLFSNTPVVVGTWDEDGEHWDSDL
jgi:hypothetical protein